MERSPTSSTLTMLPLRPLDLTVRKPLGGGGMFKAGNLIVVERLMTCAAMGKEGRYTLEDGDHSRSLPRILFSQLL